MERLKHADLQGLRTFLEETASPCDLETFGSRVLPAVQRLVPSVIACYAQVDPLEGKLVRQEVYPDTSAFKSDGSFERHMFEHPVFEQWGKAGSTPPLRTSLLVSRKEMHRRGIYQYVYKQLGCEDSLTVALPAPKGLMACICSERDVDFTDSELQLMALVQPHLVQLYRMAELFSLLGQATAHEGVQSMLLDSAGRPLVAGRDAWNLLGKYFPAPAETTSLFPRPLSSWLRSQLARFSADSELPPAPSPLSVMGEDGSTLTLRLLPGTQTGEQALLILQARQPPSTTIPRELGLSERETEVLLLARRGLTNSQIGQELYVSRRTVEKHLENIYSKLGVESRSAALARAFPS